MNARPRWARRSRPAERTCARPGCTAPAHATLQFLPARRAARLVTLDPSGAPTPGDRCERHAATLVLPRGWQLHDERPTTAVHPLADGTERTEHADDDRARRRRRPGRALDGTTPDPELDRLLDADSPLLRRAFRKTREA